MLIRRLIILLLIVGCDSITPCCLIGCPIGADVNCGECSCECRNGAEIDDCFSCDGNNYFDTDGLLPNGDCNCYGAVKDCSGDCGGDLVEDECGVCGGDGIADGECDCNENVEDCAGICGGVQFIDCTGQCGIFVIDECGVCGGNNSICKDCNGVINGSANKDNCSICVDGDTGLEACTYDCTGIWGGDAELDVCGICGGSNTDISQCNTVCPIGLELGCDKTCHPTGTQPINDECNICGGDNTVCAGCDGIPNSGLEIDVCGVCGGDGHCD